MVKMFFYLYFIICLTLSSLVLHGQTKYFSYLNNFDYLNKDCAVIENNQLIQKNNSLKRQFNVISLSEFSDIYKIYIKVANKNNKEGSIIKIIDDFGKSHAITNPEFGIVWNYIDDKNYMLLKLKCFNTNLYDILDERIMNVELIEVKSGKDIKLSSKKFRNNVNLFDGYNTIVMDYDKNNIKFSIGNNSISPIENFEFKNDSIYNIGYMIGSGACVAIDRFIIKSKQNKVTKLQTNWTRSTIDNYFKENKTDFVEGLWVYLDRNIDEQYLKIGGKYTLALIKNYIGGYDIIYYDNAKVNSSEWSCGMLKGRLSKTQFKDNYNLIWYDSTMDTFSDDTYATLSDYMILTLNFPIYKGQIRFQKVK